MGKRAILGLMMVLAVGCMSHPEKPVRYAAGLPVPPMKTVTAGGDFALYVDGAERAEIPVRVEEGQEVGFEVKEDGRVEAVAGPFKMHLPGEAQKAEWRRMNYKED